jgi:hypothetical protein
MTALYCLILCAALPFAANAMDVKICDNQLILSGSVVSGDFGTIKEAISAHPEINIAVLRNSHGGDAESGYDIGEYFRDKGISTYASGYCLSSCSRMFLGGKERFFTDDFSLGKYSVGFHSNYDKSDRIVSGAQWKLSRFIRKYSDGKADEALVDRWVNIQNRNGFAHFFHPTALKRSDGVSVLLCNGSEGNRRWELCEKIVGHDALSMGIITSLDIKHSCDAATLPKEGASASSNELRQ